MFHCSNELIPHFLTKLCLANLKIQNIFQLNQPTRCSNFPSLLLVVQIELNMFLASSCPSSGATTAVAASGLPSELGDSSAVGRGRTRPRPTALLPPRSNGKPEAAAAVVVAPDDGYVDARNMLTCI
jgi:hypothetical protein